MGKVAKFVGGAVQIVAGVYTGNAGLIASGVGSIGGGAADLERERAFRRSQEEQRRAAAISNAQQAIERQRQIRQSLAESRVRRAIFASRAFEGGPAGAGQSITADTSTAIGAAQTQQGAAFGVADALNNAATARIESRSANIFDAVESGAELFNVVSGARRAGAFEGLFSDRPATGGV